MKTWILSRRFHKTKLGGNLHNFFFFICLHCILFCPICTNSLNPASLALPDAWSRARPRGPRLVHTNIAALCKFTPLHTYFFCFKSMSYGWRHGRRPSLGTIHCFRKRAESDEKSQKMVKSGSFLRFWAPFCCPQTGTDEMCVMGWCKLGHFLYSTPCQL